MTRNRTFRRGAGATRGRSRRHVLRAMGAGAIVGVAGCLGEDDDGDDGDPDEELPEVALYDEAGERVSLTLTYDPGSANGPDIATQIRRDLGRIGIDVEFSEEPNVLQVLDSEPLDDADPDGFEWGPVGRNAGPPDETRVVGDWDLLIGIGGNTFPRTPGNTDTFWTRDGPANAFGYVPSADHRVLYDEATVEPDDDRRRELFGELFANLTQDAAANFLSQSFDHVAFREGINTAPAFNEFGAELSTINRYRGERTVSGDFVSLGSTPSQTSYPPEADDTASGARLDLVTDGSYDVDPDNEIVPLHMDVEDAGGGQVFVCTLRDNLEWGTDADGDAYGAFTAEDYVFHLEYVHGVADDAADLWEGSPPSADVPDFEVVENVERTGTYEFQIELVGPDPSFPLRPILWGDQCLPMELYETYAPDATALRESTEIGEFTWTGNLGPYTFEDRTAGVAGDFTVSRNPDYYMREHVEASNVQVMDDAWAEAPYFERYRIDIEDETSTVVERMRAGEGDTLTLPTENVEEFRQAVEDVRVEETPSPFISMLNFNMRANGHPLLDETEGRQAICMVVDKATISEEIQRGLTEPAVTWQPTWSAFYDDGEAIEYGLDVTADVVREARETLRELDGFELEDAE